jgi:N-acetylmuramic acid 6-phosphate etherase
MKKILTELNNSNSTNIDLLNTAEIIKIIHNEDKIIHQAIEEALPEIEQATDIITDSLLQNGRVAYFGAGTSGRLGVLDASECWPTYSFPKEQLKGYIAGGDYALRNSIEGAEDSIEEALKDLNDFNPTSKDVVIGISASGNPKYVLTILEQATLKGATTIGITSNPEAKLISFSKISIITKVGPEVITGSSRMKSGTAQKMVLNMLSTASMIKIGKTYKNYMIDVRPTCDKLINRANRIISEICQIPIEIADKYRIKGDNNVKIACVMYNKSCTKQEAIDLLKKHNGILRKVI